MVLSIRIDWLWGGQSNLNKKLPSSEGRRVPPFLPAICRVRCVHHSKAKRKHRLSILFRSRGHGFLLTFDRLFQRAGASKAQSGDHISLKCYDLRAFAQLVQIVAPPLRHFDTFLPVRAAMIGGTDLVAIGMG